MSIVMVFEVFVASVVLVSPAEASAAAALVTVRFCTVMNCMLAYVSI